MLRIDLKAEADVRSAIGRLDRTEDVKWSPSGRRLALAGFLANRVLILEVHVHMDGERPRVELSGKLELSSPSFDHPHGLSWLDEHTVIVANRYGRVGIFELPAHLPASGQVTLDPMRIIGEDRRDQVKTPGSVSVFPIGLDLVEVLVCNGLVHHVSRHLVDRRGPYAVHTSESLLGTGLQLPDGVAHSRSGRWIAVSSHDGHCVLVFRNDAGLNDASVPDCVLRGVHHPHGLVFTPDEKWILAADADAPFVHVFRSPDANWEGEREPVTSIQIVSDAGYARGRFQPGEGGPKGIDLNRDGTVLAATCEEDPLVFFDMRPTLGPVAVDPGPPEEAADAERARLFLLRYLGAAHSRVDDATEAIRRTSEREVQLLLANRWWRLIAPLRRLSRPMHYARRTRHRLTLGLSAHVTAARNLVRPR